MQKNRPTINEFAHGNIDRNNDNNSFVFLTTFMPHDNIFLR